MVTDSTSYVLLYVLYICVYIYIYIYVYIEREREREREIYMDYKQTNESTNICGHAVQLSELHK